MVCCSISCCKSNSSNKFNGRKMVFFSVPSKPKPTVYRGKDKAYRTALSNIKTCQHEACVSAINKSHPKGNFKYSDVSTARICIYHFHPSLIKYDEKKNKYTLNIGAAPTIKLTYFSLHNHDFQENKGMKRTVGRTEDLLCVYNYINKHGSEKGNNTSSLISFKATATTATKEERINKRRCEKDKLENDAKIRKINEDFIHSIPDLCKNFPKLSSQWFIIFSSSWIKLRRHIFTNDNLYSASQEVLIYNNMITNSCKLNVSTPQKIMLKKIDDFDSSEIKQIIYDNKKIDNIKYKNEILDIIISIEKTTGYMEKIEHQM